MSAPPPGAAKAPAADATLRLLTFLAAQRAPVAAVRIAEQLALPRSTVYDLLGALVARGYALHLPEERRYALGPAAYELAAGYARHDPLARLGRRAIAGMVDAVGESGHLAVLHGRDALYLVEERARRRPSLVTDAGVRLPAHLTASGRAMLAALTPAQLRSLYPSRTPFERRTEAPSVTSRGELVAALAAVRRDGVAWEDGEVTAGFASVAAAVTDHAGWPVAAVALTWPTATSRPEIAGRCREAVRRVAGEVGAAVG
ncbi:IclR family transcriptional regulator [Brachybacterium sp. YJGR34]|uniref:IclR family transcriptional regulator n=1 Tax=Brachybacterium sp. YJGR34 TaxID=2059911 RepID=UPI001E43DFB7|nr:IclR family transcriptional regulator [Brachybacterium sp. YJGR34]